MKALIINTSTLKCSVTLAIKNIDNGEIEIKNAYFENSEKPSECLLNKVETLLKENDLRLEDLDVFSAVVGPGSFTGTRIGLSTIYGFCYGLNKPFLKINLFDLTPKNMAVVAHAGGAYIKADKCFFANKSELDALKHENDANFVCLDSESEYFNNTFATINFENCATNYIIKKYESGDVDSIFSTEPFYIEKSQAEVSLENSLKTFVIRKATLSDVEAIMRLENVCFENNKYSAETIKSEIKKSFNTFLVGLIDNQIVCFGIFAAPSDEGEIIQICVIDKFRGMGFASKLFDEFIKIKKPKKMFLEVNKNNSSAISLYKKLGFNQIAVRKNYYENGDDCLVFSKIF